MTAVFICQHCTGHLFGHAPGCPVSKAMIEWRVAALAARPVSDSGLTRRLAERIHGNESHPRPSFAECPYEPCVEARAALASTPEPDLDVERLAQALAVVGWHHADARQQAETIAAEYTRLREAQD